MTTTDAKSRVCNSKNSHGSEYRNAFADRNRLRCGNASMSPRIDRQCSNRNESTAVSMRQMFPVSANLNIEFDLAHFAKNFKGLGALKRFLEMVELPDWMNGKPDNQRLDQSGFDRAIFDLEFQGTHFELGHFDPNYQPILNWGNHNLGK